MLAPFAGVPGKLKTLIDRLTAARAANLDSIDTTTSSRAPASTALTTAIWTNAKAAFLDASVSSRASQTSLDALGGNQILNIPPTLIVPATSDGTTLAIAYGVLTKTQRFGRLYEPSLTANIWATLISITGAGVLKWFSIYNQSSTARTVSVKITLDGVVVLDMAGGGAIGQNDGHVVVGTFENGGSHSLEAIPYSASLKIEVKSTVTDPNDVRCIYRGTTI